MNKIINKKIIALSSLAIFTALFNINCGHKSTKSEDTSSASAAATPAVPSAEEYRKLEAQAVAWKTGKMQKAAPLWAADTKRVHVIRLMATWCPYCKNDLKALNDHFQNGTFKKDQVKVHLVSYHNKRESKASVQKFAREINKRYTPFAQDSFSFSFWDKSAQDIEALQDAQGLKYFPNWQGVPYGIVIDCQDRVIFHGHFTNGPEQEAEQYALIAKAQESCAVSK